jgi:phosphopantetheinyl transferase (holo-ACP synthase)
MTRASRREHLPLHETRRNARPGELFAEERPMHEQMTTAMATDGAAARLALTSSEAERCAALPTAVGRSDFRAGRLAAKRAASVLVGRQASRAIEVVTRADGSPRLVLLQKHGGSRAIPTELSLSHRQGHAVAVVAPPGMHVGVDLERVGAVHVPSTRYFLTKDERRRACGTDPTVLWSLKEAAWKALGLGRSVPLTSLEIAFDDDGRLHGVRVNGVFLPMHTRMSSPWPGFHMAVVWVTGGMA